MCNRPGRAVSLAALSAALAAPLGVGMAGCASVFTAGTTMVDHDRGVSAEPQEAPSDGEYALYEKFGDNTPRHTVSLKKGDALGFKTAQTGQIKAIAGDDEWTMTDGDYIWKRK